MRVRASVARAAARLFLGQLGVQAPPVNAKKVLKSLARLYYFEHPCDDGHTAYDALTGSYKVYINRYSPEGRVNWTYAHEIGHIKLRHLENYDPDLLTDEEHWVLDREANIFAAEFLMPKSWLVRYAKLPLTIPDIGQLKDLFDVSWEAMINRLDELGIQSKLETRACFEITAPKAEIATTSIEQVENYCLRIPIKFEGAVRVAEVRHIKYHESRSRELRIWMDSNGRLTQCPRCGNSDFSPKAKYCKRCGLYLYNDCTNTEPGLYEVCGKTNPPDAAFCEFCGGKTYFNELGIVEPASQPENALVIFAPPEVDAPF